MNGRTTIQLYTSACFIGRLFRIARIYIRQMLLPSFRTVQLRAHIHVSGQLFSDLERFTTIWNRPIHEFASFGKQWLALIRQYSHILKVFAIFHCSLPIPWNEPNFVNTILGTILCSPMSVIRLCKTDLLFDNLFECLGTDKNHMEVQCL